MTAPWLAREGAILIVPRPAAVRSKLCGTVDEFAAAGGPNIHILAVAGGGTSALGSAAFARNVADAFETTVAAVVSGYGLSDLLTEALGGWFWFSALNRFSHQFVGSTVPRRILRHTPCLYGKAGWTVRMYTHVAVCVCDKARFSVRLLSC
ncbi:hypothetical protein G6321_00053645 [Bradyrhizobium barranii subsp. barranii]|uniref:Uncharacterized protein n=1 Tax=Bradyrhizobium barranii subsp. barranii TaxID=2823807 RepID=A0A9X9YTN3_9BRAD|nr:hypothetical protein [Bradyrhizobium barranii]UGX94288.1 hypothetical protein G6321_00053645 [Bradyrhizobium barranii subsp. barranii]